MITPNRLVGYRIVYDTGDPRYVMQVMDYKVYELNITPEECARQANEFASELRNHPPNAGIVFRVVPLMSF